MMDPVPSWIHSDPLRRIAAAKAIYEPYTQPQTRRGFFRYLLGLPERAQQVSAVAEEPWIAQEQYFAPYDDPADPFGVATQDRIGWSSPEDRARTTRYAALSRVLDRGTDPRTVEDAGAMYLGTSVDKPWEEDPARAALRDQLIEFLTPVEPEPPSPSPIAAPLDAFMRRIGVRR
jgi:hypothetical protein